MSKVQLKIKLQSSEENQNFTVPAIINNNILIYKEPNNTTVKYDFNTNILTRENNHLFLKYHFVVDKPTVGNIVIKDIQKSLDIPIKTKNLFKEENKIKIDFIVDESPILYELEYK